MLRALYTAAAWIWWTFVRWNGGPGHISYDHATWERWKAGEYLRRWLNDRRTP